MSKSQPDILHRTRVAALWLVALLIVGLVGSAIAWRMRLTRAVDAQLAALRAAGLPTSGAELNQWYPAVPDSENAALALTQAFAFFFLCFLVTFCDRRDCQQAARRAGQVIDRGGKESSV